MFLGVHRFAPNKAINGDIGWRSTLTKKWPCALRLWNKLCLLLPNRLCKQIFVRDDSVCHNNWCSEVKKIIILIFDDDIDYQAKLCVDIYFCDSTLEELERAEWGEYKVTQILFERHRSVLTQFRCGIPPTKIEIARFNNIPVELRLCEMCDLNSIEDETSIFCSIVVCIPHFALFCMKRLVNTSQNFPKWSMSCNCDY